MAPAAVLGIDLGTSSTKAALVDDRGRILAECAAAHPATARVQVRLWWDCVVRAVRAVLQAQPARVAAVGLSGQMHGVVLLDRALQPLAPAITWADTRSPEPVAELAAAHLPALGNPVVAGMAAVSLWWLRQCEPRLLDSARLAVAPKDWLGAVLTGCAVTDPTDASATLLWDLGADAWHDELAAALGLDSGLLPAVWPSDQVRGQLLAPAAEQLGLPAGLAVTVGRGDTAAALVGSGAPALPTAGSVARPGLLAVGTGGQLCLVTTEPRPDPALRTHLYRGPGAGQWYAMAATLSAGLALDWVRRLLHTDWATLHDEAFSCPPGADGVTFLPYVAGERTPHLDPLLSAAFSGLRLRHHRGHAARAALEGTAFALRDAWDALRAAGHDAGVLVLAGGGGVDPRRRQLLADVLRRPLASTPHGGGSARGAALSAAVASGWFTDLEQAMATAGPATVTAEPGPYDYAEPLTRFHAAAAAARPPLSAAESRAGGGVPQ